MPHSTRWVWAALLTAGVAHELWTVHKRRDADTLSATTRAAFHTDTTVGRTVWLTSWCGFAAWFAAHIVKRNTH